MFKALIVALLLVILGSLGNALYHLLKDRALSAHMVKALTVRISLSVALFLLLLLAARIGWIRPHSIQEGYLHQRGAGMQTPRPPAP